MHERDRLRFYVAHGAVRASALVTRAGIQVRAALGVAAAYRRALRVSRDFRRLPA
jgi:hypothetical protein